MRENRVNQSRFRAISNWPAKTAALASFAWQRFHLVFWILRSQTDRMKTSVCILFLVLFASDTFGAPVSVKGMRIGEGDIADSRAPTRT
jgi:hypothetical protein